MKKRMIHIITDVLLISVVFSVTDIVWRKVFCSENLWLELGIYLVCYAIVFGLKRGVVLLWKRFRKEG